MTLVTERANAIARDDRRAHWVVFGVTLVGGWLRLATWPDFSFFGDEIWTLEWSREPWLHVMTSYGRGLTSHLYILAMKPWLALVGVSPQAAKLPSLLAGIALVPLVYLAASHWLDRCVAPVAAALTALSGPLIYFSRVARVYMPLTVLALLSMLAFVRLVGTTRRREWLLLTAGNTTLICSSLLSAYVLAVQGCALLVELLFVRGARRMPWRALVASWAVTVVLGGFFYLGALPSILLVWQQASSAPLRPGLLWGSFEINHPSLPIVFAILVAVGAGVALKRHPRVGRVLLSWAVVPPLFILVQRPAFVDGHIARYLVPTLPAQLMLAAAGLCFLLSPLRAAVPSTLGPLLHLVAVAALMLASPVARSAPFVERLPYAPALRQIGRLAAPGDLLTTFGYPPFAAQIRYQKLIPTASMAALVRGETELPRGRLVILTVDLPRAVEAWAPAFEVERIAATRFRQRLYVLVSTPASAEGAHLETALRAFFLGVVQAAEAGDRLHSNPFHHHRRLTEAHRHLARLSRAAGDQEGAELHLRKAEASRLAADAHGDLQ